MPDNVRIDLNQTLRHRLIERYGPNAAIPEFIVAGHTGITLKNYIKERLQDLITAGNVIEGSVDNIHRMGHWVTVG
ncbi:MAG: hypothetical protein KAW51_06785 [Candidatus Lokiarchaeota archaeon]|nr:hypothetical protein [Candidatus Lokiarchaeota archaeon]